MISATTGKEVKGGIKRRKRTIAAYSGKGFVEDPDGNHQSFNIYRWKNPIYSSSQEEIEAHLATFKGTDFLFVRSCYKFRTAKRILQSL